MPIDAEHESRVIQEFASQELSALVRAHSFRHLALAALDMGRGYADRIAVLEQQNARLRDELRRYTATAVGA